MSLKSVVDKISIFLCKFSCIAIAVMMILMVADAFSRKLIGSIPGGFYTTIAILAVLLFMPQGYAQMLKAHITVDLVTSKLSKKRQLQLSIISNILAVFFFTVLAWAGALKAVEATCAQEEWMGAVFYPSWPWRWCIPIGLVVFTLQLILTLVEEIAKYKGRAD